MVTGVCGTIDTGRGGCGASRVMLIGGASTGILIVTSGGGTETGGGLSRVGLGGGGGVSLTSSGLMMLTCTSLTICATMAWPKPVMKAQAMNTCSATIAT